MEPQAFATAGRGLLVGAATGLRSTAGIASTVWAAPSGDVGSWWERLGGPRVRRIAAAAVLGEMLVDKHPSLPSRLHPAVLAGRVAIGMAGAVALSRRAGTPPMVPVIAAAAGAIAAAVIGARLRNANRHGIGRYGVAVAEDLVAVGLAIAAGVGQTPRPGWNESGAAEGQLLDQNLKS